MKLNGQVVAYTTPDGLPVLSVKGEFEPGEQDLVDLRDQIVADTDFGPIKAGIMALSAAVDYEPSFLAWMTCGVMKYTEHGIACSDPAVLAWLQSVRESGRVF